MIARPTLSNEATGIERLSRTAACVLSSRARSEHRRAADLRAALGAAEPLPVPGDLRARLMAVAANTRPRGNQDPEEANDMAACTATVSVPARRGAIPRAVAGVAIAATIIAVVATIASYTANRASATLAQVVLRDLRDAGLQRQLLLNGRQLARATVMRSPEGSHAVLGSYIIREEGVVAEFIEGDPASLDVDRPAERDVVFPRQGELSWRASVTGDAVSLANDSGYDLNSPPADLLDGLLEGSWQDDDWTAERGDMLTLTVVEDSGATREVQAPRIALRLRGEYGSGRAPDGKRVENWALTVAEADPPVLVSGVMMTEERTAEGVVYDRELAAVAVTEFREHGGLLYAAREAMAIEVSGDGQVELRNTQLRRILDESPLLTVAWPVAEAPEGAEAGGEFPPDAIGLPSHDDFATAGVRALWAEALKADPPSLDEVLALCDALPWEGARPGPASPPADLAEASAERTGCLSNMRQLATAAVVVAQEHGGVLPETEEALWEAARAAGYRNLDQLLVCPSDDAPPSYAVNPQILGVNIDLLEDPERTLMLFESDGGETPAFRHNGRILCATCDGRALVCTPEEFEALERTPVLRRAEASPEEVDLKARIREARTLRAPLKSLVLRVMLSSVSEAAHYGPGPVIGDYVVGLSARSQLLGPMAFFVFDRAWVADEGAWIDAETQWSPCDGVLFQFPSEWREPSGAIPERFPGRFPRGEVAPEHSVYSGWIAEAGDLGVLLGLRDESQPGAGRLGVPVSSEWRFAGQEERDGRRLLRFEADDADRYVVWVDPDRGYLTVRAERRSPRGQMVTIATQVSQTAGLWLPTETECHRLRQTEGGGREPVMSDYMTFVHAAGSPASPIFVAPRARAETINWPSPDPSFPDDHGRDVIDRMERGELPVDREPPERFEWWMDE